MSIIIKNKEDIRAMRASGKLAAKLMDYITPFVKEGVSTLYLNDLCEDWTRAHGAISATVGYNGYPKSICSSKNDVVCHGIPSAEDVLEDGDILNIDVTVKLNGYHGDMSRMFMIGNVSEEAKLLVERTKTAMERGIAAVKPGAYFGDIGAAIQNYIGKFGYGIVREFGGHGIGTVFHEEPWVGHFKGAKGDRIEAGMIFTVEPMINLGGSDLYIEDDDWTARTVDGSISAQWEHTILVTHNGAEKLTVSE